MKSLIAIIISLLVGLTAYAEIDKKTLKAINDANTNIGVVLSYLQDQDKNLDAELLKANTANQKCTTRVENFKNRHVATSPTEEDIKDYLLSFSSLDDLLDKRAEVIEKLKPLRNNEYAESYLLIIDMYNSLESIYDEGINKELLKKAGSSLKIIDDHLDDYNLLLSQVKDYRFGMYELGRLFEVIDETDYNGSAANLAKKEDVSDDVIKIPFINRTLNNYIKFKKYKSSRYMSEEDRSSLYNALPDAFPMLKND